MVFSTAYLPPIEYFKELAKYRSIYIDKYENYIKQTYRNRCNIYTANGKLSLSVPVIKTTGNHTKIKDIEIDNNQAWQHIHWLSIESAYNSSPFFLYYRDYFEPFYNKKFKYLIDLNTELLYLLLKLCDISCEIKFSESYIETSEILKDYKSIISPKNKKSLVPIFPEYTQVFDDKHGFMQNLSIVDLLFCEGTGCRTYLEL
ncbi:MAG: WbqC family protein [Bacteroidetes bacterium]|nr:WbqC family protein [Bacteroidota bacterium]